MPQNDPLEATALAPRSLGRGNLLFLCVLPVIVITCSASLIRINQLLMEDDHFPYPVVLVLMHCIFCSMAGLMLLCLRPSLFPSLSDPDQKAHFSLSFYLTSVFPIAICFTSSLVLSNLAYEYCSVAFLQMLKEGNIIAIFAFSYLAGLETFAMTKLGILLVMLLATLSCVDGELNFNLLGMVVQVTAGLCEATKTVLQSLLLSGKGVKLDPMSMVLTLMPMCGLLLSLLLVFHGLVMPLSFVALPSFPEIWTFRTLLSLSMCNAFALNIVIAVFLKYLSPVSYILTGNIKDIVVVCMSALLVREPISSMQVLGFSVQVSCVMAWTSYKQTGNVFPKELILQAFGTASSDKLDTEK